MTVKRGKAHWRYGQRVAGWKHHTCEACCREYPDKPAGYEDRKGPGVTHRERVHTRECPYCGFADPTRVNTKHLKPMFLQPDDRNSFVGCGEDTADPLPDPTPITPFYSGQPAKQDYQQVEPSEVPIDTYRPREWQQDPISPLDRTPHSGYFPPR